MLMQHYHTDSKCKRENYHDSCVQGDGWCIYSEPSLKDRNPSKWQRTNLLQRVYLRECEKVFVHLDADPWRNTVVVIKMSCHVGPSMAVKPL